jgi:MFS superfamily sulfate permease-like transporter
MQIPQGMAYALLAGLPPVYGLYNSIFPPLVYMLLGTSTHLSLGTVAPVSLLVATAIETGTPPETGSIFFALFTTSLLVFLQKPEAC